MVGVSSGDMSNILHNPRHLTLWGYGVFPLVGNAGFVHQPSSTITERFGDILTPRNLPDRVRSSVSCNSKASGCVYGFSHKSLRS